MCHGRAFWSRVGLQTKFSNLLGFCLDGDPGDLQLLNSFHVRNAYKNASAG